MKQDNWWRAGWITLTTQHHNVFWQICFRFECHMPGSLAPRNFGPHFSQNQKMMGNTMLLNICLVNFTGHRTNLETRNKLIWLQKSCPIHTIEQDSQGDCGHTSAKNHWPPHAINALLQWPHLRLSWSLDNNMWKLKDHCDNWPQNAFNNTCAPYLNLESLSKSVCKLTTSKSASKVYFQWFCNVEKQTCAMPLEKKQLLSTR